MKMVINPSRNVGEWTWAGSVPHPSTVPPRDLERELDDGTWVGSPGVVSHPDGTPLRMTAVAVKGRAVRLPDAS